MRKFKYLKNKNRFLDEIKNIFHSFWMAIIWWKIKFWQKIADTSFTFPECQKWTVPGRSLFLLLFSHSGKDYTCNVREYLCCITQAIVEKVAAVLASAHFFAVLSDGSQAQKTGSKNWLWSVLKEMVRSYLLYDYIAMHKKSFSKENFRILNTLYWSLIMVGSSCF